ncbi:accessory Sec system S-layer assembly protein [Bacillus sp. FJAT-49736]|uniref:accessory Sec system S-layer assembly protein n=1 Tax=Bacillus sp. FJAT-49736 TaxID=2833582 RepID=UPI001BC9FC15|nr:accessory Sec system S-layer assembly protein [Bacillus sp. FJAT-49736]MBS4174183.1 accessory Sec system S-layer assembly protein [Bacillus sp. FJAT-49736]
MLFSGKKKLGKDSTFSSKELLNEEAPIQSDELEIETSLSLPPNWVDSPEQEYVLRFLNNECAPLKPNQISLAGIEHVDGENGELTITAFVRSSLDKAIKFDQVALVLLGTDEELLARKTFDLSGLGELPPRSSRPWHFTFDADSIVSETIPQEGWKLAFELKPEHRLDLAETWENSLPETEKEKLKQLIGNMNPPGPGEVNFMGLQIKHADNGDLHVTILIRNGADKNISIESLPLIVEDAARDIVAQGGFQLSEFEVKANTSKPWTFIFPKSLVSKKNPDFSTWRVYPRQ